MIMQCKAMRNGIADDSYIPLAQNFTWNLIVP